MTVRYFVVIDAGSPLAGFHAKVSKAFVERPTSGEPLPPHPMLSCDSVEFAHPHLLRLTLAPKEEGAASTVVWVPYQHALAVLEDGERPSFSGFCPASPAST